MLSQHSMSLLGGDLLDSSPPARHTEAVGGLYSGLRPAPIDAVDPQEFKTGRESDNAMPKCSFKFEFLCSYASSEINMKSNC